MPRSRGIQSIEVGYRVLEVLEEAMGPTSLKEIAQRAKMTPTKAHYYLTSFVRIGLAAQDGPGGRYELGPSALRLGLAALARLDLAGIARDAMFDLRNATGAAVFFSVWGNRGPTVVQSIDGSHFSPLSIRIGTVLEPLSETGLAILSTFDEPTARAVVAQALKDTRADHRWQGRSLDAAMAALVDVRHAKYARTLATEAGYAGLSAPILTFEGAPQALTMTGNRGSLDMRQTGSDVRALLAATGRIANLAGGLHQQQVEKKRAKPDAELSA